MSSLHRDDEDKPVDEEGKSNLVGDTQTLAKATRDDPICQICFDEQSSFLSNSFQTRHHFKFDFDSNVWLFYLRLYFLGRDLPLTNVPEMFTPLHRHEPSRIT